MHVSVKLCIVELDDDNCRHKKGKLMNEAIKEAGKAGLLYAYDEHDVYTPAEEAEPGKTYYCPMCRCLMHVVTPKLGRKYYARNPHETHLDPRCHTIEKKGKTRSFAGLDPETFISSLCHSSPNQRVVTGGNPKGGNGGETPATPDDAGIKLAKFTSLRQIAESDILFLKEDDRQGDHLISDFILTYRNADSILDGLFIFFECKIIYARYDRSVPNKQILLFTLWTQKHSLKLILMIPSKAEFRKIREKFETYVEDDKGRTVLRKNVKKQDVLIASDAWNHISEPRCRDICSAGQEKCKNCCGMFQAVYTNAKMLYLFPPD